MYFKFEAAKVLWRTNTEGPNIAESFCQKISAILGYFGDIGTFGDMGTKFFF
jgi:hypothetical protein